MSPPKIEDTLQVVKPPSDRNFVLTMLTPAFTLFIIGIAVPLFLAVYLSLISSTGLQLFGKYTGFSNFREFLFPQHRYTRIFYQYTYQTIFFVVISVTLEFFLGLGFALLLNKEFRGRALARATLLIPWAVPTVVSATIFLEIFAPANNFGLVNNILEALGFDTVFFYGDPLENIGSDSIVVYKETFPFYQTSETTQIRYEYAMFTVIAVEVWKTTPFIALLLLAALQIVPEDLYKAADIEGANVWQKFRYITWPNIRGPALIAILFRTIDAIRVYDAVVVFGDNSVQSVTVVAVTAWSQQQFGVASAVAIFELILIIIFALIIFKGNKFTHSGAFTVFLLLFNRFLVIGVTAFLLILVFVYVSRFMEKERYPRIKKTIRWDKVNFDIIKRRTKSEEELQFRPRSKNVIRLRRRLNKVLLYLGIFSLVAFCIAPFIWVFIRSFRDPCLRIDKNKGCPESSPPQSEFEFLPKYPSIQSYKIIFSGSQTDFAKALINSVILASLTAILVIIIGSLVAVILAKYEFKFQTSFILMIFAMSSLPPIIIIIPYLLQINYLSDHGINLRNASIDTILNYLSDYGINLPNNGIINSIVKLIGPYPGPLFPLLIPYVAFNLPLGVFLLRSFFTEIPNELLLAAKVDGASNFQIFRKILLPLTRPGIFTTWMMVFIIAWNELLFARMFLIGNEEFRTVPLAILQFQKSNSEILGIPWSSSLVLATASIIATLPLIILVLILQKNIIKGITAGAVKG